MKARFFALAALVLGLASCQNDFDGANVGVGGEVDFQLAVSAPEFGATRADGDFDEDGNNKNGYNSAYGAIDYLSAADWESVDLRYSLEVYDYDPVNKTIGDVLVKDRMVKVLDMYEPVVFELRLVPGRHYHFVVFADFVDEGADDTPKVDVQANIGKHHIIGNTLADIRLKNDAINTELTDAYFATAQFEITNSAAKDMILRRPYGKVRVVATDLHELNLNVEATSVKVTYTKPNANKFNAVEGKISGEGATTFEATYNVATDTYSEYTVGYDDDTTTALNGTVRKSHMTLSTDYILAVDEQKPIQFSIEVFDQNGQPIKETVFSTDIPVQRNYLTTVIGNVLTSGTEINISIDDNFAGEKNWPETNEEELAYAAMFGGEVTLEQDITLDEPLTIVADAKVVINLNGKTITAGVKQEGRHHYAIDNYGTLTLEGEGAINARGIENFGIMTIDGDITITNVDTNGGAAIWNEGDIVINGGTFTTNAAAGEGSYGVALNTRENGKAVVNGGNFIANSQLSYAIINAGETVINNATVIGKHGAVAGDGSNSTVINGGSFSLMENPNVSDHCTYCVSSISGGTFTLGNNTDCGAQVFYDSTIAAGYKAVAVDGIYYVLPETIANAAEAEGVTAVTESAADVKTALANNNGEVTLFMWNDVAYIAKFGEVVITSDADEATTVRGVVEYSTGLTSATVAEGIEVVGNRTFRQCANLETVVLPNTLTEIGPAVFQTCSKLANITIPESVTTIGEGAFAECTSLASINIPDGITRLEKDVLRNTGLVSIEIPASVNYIGTWAFRDCESLTEIKILSPEFTIENNSFTNMAAPVPTMTIHVVNNEMKAYLESTLTAYDKTYITVVGPKSVSNAAELKDALNNPSISTITLQTGEYGTIVAKSNKTIIGTPGAKVDCVDLNGADNLTLKNINFDAATAKMGYDGKGTAKQPANIISGSTSKCNKGAHNLVIEGCTFTGTFADGGVAIAFTDQKRGGGGSGNITIKDCTFNTRGGYCDIYGHYTGDGINGFGNFAIEGNEFNTEYLSGGNPIYLGRYASSTPVVVKGNEFNNVTTLNEAVYLQAHSNSYVVSIDASNNTFAN